MGQAEQIRTLAKIHKKRKKDGILPEDRNRIHVNDRIDPVVTLVLYLGEGKWKGRDHLSELFGIDDELKELHELMGTEEFQQLSGEAQEAIASHLKNPKLLKKMKEKNMEMCQAFRELEEDWQNKGMEKGIKEGKLQVVRQMIKEGLDKAIILKCTQCTEAEYAKAAKSAKG